MPAEEQVSVNRGGAKSWVSKIKAKGLEAGQSTLRARR